MASSHDAPLVTRRFLLICALILLLLFIANCVFLSGPHGLSLLYQEWLPSVHGSDERQIGPHTWRKSKEPGAHVELEDKHPIRALILEADAAFEQYERGRSQTFKQTVKRYRREHGRHPPPGFKEWYKFARNYHVYDIDCFHQISSDLRPFWSLPPATIRRYAAHASDNPAHNLAVISLRDGQVFQKLWAWKTETFVKMLEKIAKWLPDMDIPLNRMDQPRVVVPWEEMQDMLQVEVGSRSPKEGGVKNEFTKDIGGFWRPNPQFPEPKWWNNRWNPFFYPKDLRNDPDDPPAVYEWFSHANKPFMDLAAKACPPDSYARNPSSTSHRDAAEQSYTTPLGGFITNANLSTDLCTVGPTLANQHGFLYASISMLATRKLLPVFSECKTSVNNDILFPANMYWRQDDRYGYNDREDIEWDEKDDVMPWRGVTSGGMAYARDEEGWRNMQRQRLVMMTNSTLLEEKAEIKSILTLEDAKSSSGRKSYTQNPFRPADFAKQHTDIGFTKAIACIPRTCSFYDSVFSFLAKTSFAETFKSKFLIDVDGHTFSGRWSAFLLSRSLGLKSTIFREWHDARLRPWRDYVPVSVGLDELYSLLTYFIGLNNTSSSSANRTITFPRGDGGGLVVPKHDYEAYRLASQGREQAKRVLRREDMEIYLFRLLLEYGRVIDDNRNAIGLVGDGGWEMEEFDRRVPAVD